MYLNSAFLLVTPYYLVSQETKHAHTGGADTNQVTCILEKHQFYRHHQINEDWNLKHSIFKDLKDTSALASVSNRGSFHLYECLTMLMPVSRKHVQFVPWHIFIPFNEFDISISVESPHMKNCTYTYNILYLDPVLHFYLPDIFQFFCSVQRGIVCEMWH